VQGSIKIHIKDESEVYVPNSFTPNGDLFNDIFKLILPNENYTIQVFEIYSRWGEQLYKEERTSGASHVGWNGSFKGNALSPGVFIYYAKVMTPNGKVKEIAGDFTLIK
jgi:gliding motility-associated-like protein